MRFCAAFRMGPRAVETTARTKQEGSKKCRGSLKRECGLGGTKKTIEVARRPRKKERLRKLARLHAPRRGTPERAQRRAPHQLQLANSQLDRPSRSGYLQFPKPSQLEDGWSTEQMAPAQLQHVVQKLRGARYQRGSLHDLTPLHLFGCSSRYAESESRQVDRKRGSLSQPAGARDETHTLARCDSPWPRTTHVRVARSHSL